MYAIVDIAGQQFKVEKDQELFVHRLKGKEGDKVEFNNVLLIDNNGKVAFGTPVIDGALIKARIVEHLKGDKVLVFKKKRRKGYQKLNGHRQYLTKLFIENILEKEAKPKATKETAAKKETLEKKQVSAPETKKTAEDKPVKKKSPAAKETAKETKKPQAKKEVKKEGPATTKKAKTPEGKQAGTQKETKATGKATTSKTTTAKKKATKKPKETGDTGKDQKEKK